jgi:hypothetical protein
VEIYLTVKLHWFFCLRLGFVPASMIMAKEIKTERKNYKKEREKKEKSLY